MLRDNLVTLIKFLFLLAILFQSCRATERDASDKIESEWRRREQVFIDLRDGNNVRVADFNEACLFFSKLTDIEIPSSHNLVIDCYPTDESYKALEPLRKWYKKNRHRLYWDDATNSIKLRSDYLTAGS